IEVLERGIRHNGASISTYRLPDGAEGMAHTQFWVAHRRGKVCLTCGSPITRISIRGRGTYFCPECQPE
ncbi:MAG: DNA-formamidopyrimidine glycosylase, partial [Chloroflexi bacterium]|nr:DNA-formamidopyrimidine glycosylase [Chloroflexota bacterium]